MNTWQTQYGPWALITGASDGIGRAMALDIARRGLNVVLVARRQTKLDALAAEIHAQHGVQTQIVAADLGTQAGLDSVMAATDGLEIGLLVASAGFGTTGALIDCDIYTELALLDVNVRAVLVMAHHYGGRMAARGRGGVVLMSSLVAFQGVPLSGNYAATKAYTQSLAESLHVELAPRGVDVIASAPGPVHSGFAARADMQMGAALTPQTVAVKTLDALGRRMTVRPGLLSKVLQGSLAMLPRGYRVRAMQRVMAGMTAHQAQNRVQSRHGTT